MTMMRTFTIAACVATWLSTVASAQPEQPEPSPQPAADPPASEAKPEAEAKPKPKYTGHTANSVKDAPKTHEAHNRTQEPSREGEGILWVPRILLFPVRVAGEVVAFPLRWGLYAYEVYSLGPRVKGIFFNEDGTVGVYPTALIETGFGLNIGGRLILRRIISDTGLTARAGIGGRFRRIFSTKISTRDSFEKFELELEGVYEVRPKDRFYGIGNTDELDAAPAMPLDPFASDAQKSRFQQDAIRVTAAAGYRLTPELTLRLSAAIVDRQFDNGEEDTPEGQLIESNFTTDDLTGYNDGTNTLYTELELSYDTRRSPSFWEGKSTPSTGSLFKVFAGTTYGFGDDPARYVRYGVDLQRYLRLAPAPRTLALRLYVEGVTGAYDEVSFYDLPRLGGPLLLRGYDQDRFRDRVAGLGSAEYQWDAMEFLSGFVFADVGRVYSDVDDLNLDNLRLGFGGGLEFHTKGSFLGRLTLASSKDGGFFATLSFDPVYDVRGRVERK